MAGDLVMSANYAVDAPPAPPPPWRQRDRRVPPELIDALARTPDSNGLVWLTPQDVMCLINCGAATWDAATRTVTFDHMAWLDGEYRSDWRSMAVWEERAQMIRSMARRHRITLTPEMPAVSGNPLLSQA